MFEISGETALFKKNIEYTMFALYRMFFVEIKGYEKDIRILKVPLITTTDVNKIFNFGQ